MTAFDRHDRDTVFLVNLLQDVNILRGLAYLAARETDTNIRFLLSQPFLTRDGQGIWQSQIAQIAADIGATIHVYASPIEALAVLQGRQGLLIAASETRLTPHVHVHDVFRVAPSGFLKVTLQHGFEGAGFLQNREHVLTYGRNVTSGADVLCSWAELPALTSLPAEMRARLYPTGPATLLQRARPDAEHPSTDGGMVCENLHSVRLKATGNHGAAFMDIFFEFCARQAGRGRPVTLRPHPGGQYVLRNNITLPDNVVLNNLPISNVALGRYAWGISAPSTVVMDMVLAGIPTAVWRDPAGVMDAGNYTGLTEIRGLGDWVAFEAEATTAPETILERQRAFLDRVSMITDADEVYRRFSRLLVNATTMLPARTRVTTTPAGPSLPAPAPLKGRPRKILFIANALIPTLQLSFLKPLAPLVAKGEVAHALLTEKDLNDAMGKQRLAPEGQAWFHDQIAAEAPDLIVCCRYAGPHPDVARAYADAAGIPLIFHVDDDLLNIPREIGARKFEEHNKPKRLATVRYLLDRSDLVYASTPALKQRLRHLGVTTPMVAGEVYCTADILRLARPGPVRKIGYMGFDHAHDFEIALPALVSCLEQNAEVQFELFGSIPMPDVLARFGDRVSTVPPVRDYALFLQALADREWDIGICPLALTAFNSVKANTKWVEYTACGMATIATRGMVYDDCASGGAGLLVDEGDWGHAFAALLARPEQAYDLARVAQARLLTRYSQDRLRAQIAMVFDRALDQVARRQSAARLLPALGQPQLPDAEGRFQPAAG